MNQNYNKWLEGAWWIIPVAMFLYAVFNNEGYRASVAWSAALAAAACILTIMLASYKLMSFITIFNVMTLISYPIAAFANLVIDHPVVRVDLWRQTDAAMWGCAIGAMSMALGVYVSDIHSRRRGAEIVQFILPLAPVGLNIGLFLILPVVALIKLHLGLYYHSSIQPYNFAAQHYLNLLEHLTWISYSGIFLQVGRFTQTRAIKDGLFAVVMCFIAVLLFLPSGNRVQAIGFLPVLIIAYLSWETRLRQKIWVVCVCIVSSLFIFHAMSIYRTNPELKRYDSYERVSRFVNVLLTPKSEGYTANYQFFNRLSDYVATGRIISTTPDPYPYRFSENMENWWQIMVPGFLRPKGHELNFMEGAETTLKYGVSEAGGGSTPVMLLGDLFSRFGWVGIVGGMFLVGVILKKLDTNIFEDCTFQKIFFFILFARIIWQLYTDSLLIALASLTRELIFIYFLSYLLGKLTIKFSRKSAKELGLRVT